MNTLSETTGREISQSQLEVLIEESIKHNWALMIEGAPGVGKTRIIESVCNRLDLEMMYLHAVTMEPVDAAGQPWVVDGKAARLPYPELQRLMEATAPLVCIYDDLGQAMPATQGSLMQQFDARTVNGMAISEHVRFICATNRRQDRAGVGGILEPVKGRMHTIVELKPEVDDWLDWAVNARINYLVSAFIRFRPELLWAFEPTNGMDQTPNPRTVVHVSDIMNSDLADNKKLLPAVLTGAVGRAFQLQFTAFLELVDHVPDPFECLSQPMLAPVPPEAQLSACFAITASLRKHVTRDTLQNAFTYLGRLPHSLGGVGEYELFFGVDVGADPELAETAAYINWSTRPEVSKALNV